MMNPPSTKEHQRLADSESRRADWKKWGPYLSERAWGTVREDYSADGQAWEYFPHEAARSRAYRWNEDGLGGFCNCFQNICLAVALWNEKDPILKERFFGVTGKQGNHGEDVKEYYFYLDSTPTHSYAKMLYLYPQAAYPYEHLVEENKHRSRYDSEYELVDALEKDFAEHRYFEIYIEYAKADEEDILCRISATNRSRDSAPIHILPHLWFRNTWSWGYSRSRPEWIALDSHTVNTHDRHLGERWWYVDTNLSQAREAIPSLLFTENETHFELLYGVPNASSYTKDAFHEAVVHNHLERLNPGLRGTKAAAHYQALLAPGETCTVRTRFSDEQKNNPFLDFENVFAMRIQEADEFYSQI